MGYRYNTFEDPHGIGPDNKANPIWGKGPAEGLRNIAYKARANICASVLEATGYTPLIRLNRIPKEEGLKCEVLVKCEFLNPGGSVKDRIAFRMMEEAEKDGVLKPGQSTIIEATAGNTGIGIALAAAVKGYKCIVVVPEKVSFEKIDILVGLGAKVVRAPTGVGFEDPRSHVQVARKLCKETPGGVILDHHRNPYNPITHYDATAEEIILQCEGKLDMVVVCVGSGGTVTGVGRKLKEKVSSCTVVGVDHKCSVLADNGASKEHAENSYEVEGIGNDFVPAVLNHDYVDKWEKVRDDEGLPMARRLIKTEGLLCGGSSGCALVGAIRVAKQLTENQRCVIILPDAVRNYLSKFLSNEWMIERDMMPRVFPEPLTRPRWFDKPLTDLPLEPPIVLPKEATFADAFAALASTGMPYVLINDKRYKASFGSVSSSDVLKAMTSAEGLSSLVDTPPRLPILSITGGSTLGQLHEVLIGGRAPACVIVDDWGVPVACVNSTGLLGFLQHLRNQSRREKARRRHGAPTHNKGSLTIRRAE